MPNSNACKSLLVACLALLLTQCDITEQKVSLDELTPFVGTFEGTSVDVAKGEMSERDLQVTIKPWEEKGFTVEWSTVIYKESGEKSKSHSINFFRTDRQGIFSSAMKTDSFGKSVPYDPIDEEGQPYVWAGLRDNTLTVTALYIIEGGGYEMQVYRRTLDADGMTLDFERVRNGEKVTAVSAQLKPAGT